MSRPIRQENVHFLGTVTVEPGGVLPLGPEVLRTLGVSKGDYVCFQLGEDCLQLQRAALKPARGRLIPGGGEGRG